jgi:hypothetical protein
MSTIKFTKSPSGKMEIVDGNAFLNALSYLGAMRLTANYTEYGAKYATDEEGLKEMIDLANKTVNDLCFYIEGIGTLLARESRENSEISLAIQNAGWLLAGLGGVTAEISQVKISMERALDQID